MNVPAPVDHSVLRSLISTLHGLEANGVERISNGCWYKEGESCLQVDGKMLPATPQIIDDLYRMRGIQSLLRGLLDSVTSERERFRLENEQAILHYGISSLPDELLQHILEMTLEEDIYHYHISTRLPNYFNYTRVCRRFREALVNNPRLRLWRVIENHRSPEWRALQLERSKNCSLTISSLDTATDYGKSKEFWLSLEGCSKRWEDVEIRRAGGEADGAHDVEELQFVLPTKLDLPLLSRLSIYGHALQPSPQNVHFPDDVLVRPCRSWNMPNLRYLTADESAFALTLPVSLQTLYMYISFTRSAISALLDVLRADVGKNLNQLSLNESKNDYQGPLSAMPIATINSAITMNRLNGLRLQFDAWQETSLFMLQQFVRCLSLPDIKVVDISFDSMPNSDNRIALREWLAGRDFTSLKTLMVTVRAFGGGNHEANKSIIRSELQEWMENRWAEENCRPELIFKYRPEPDELYDSFDDYWDYYGEEDVGGFADGFADDWEEEEENEDGVDMDNAFW